MKAPMASTEFGFNTPFKEQLDFFRQKINLPSERWDDITKEAHDKAFIVAGAANADMLADFNSAIEKAIAQGKGLEAFRKDFKSIVAKYGWVNYTGAGSAAGIAWRTKVIYQTNMSTSYAAGRYKQLTDPDFLKLRPNWKYVHSDSVQHPRPLHQSWDGTVLPHDHPFWQTHFTPNGWGCQCRIVPARGGEAIKPPPQGWDKINPKTGAPIGIDKGFDYAPGASIQNKMQSIIENKINSLPVSLAVQLENKLNEVMETKIYDVLTLPRSGVAKNASKITLEEIDKLHRIKPITEIPVKNSSSQSYQGQYSYYEASGKPVEIKVSTASVNPELTLAHEIGHYLDHQLFGAGNYASKTSDLFKRWREAVDKSEATKELRTASKESKSRIEAKRVAYYLNPVEQWARSYSQWLAHRSNNSILLEQVNKIVVDKNKVYAASQWQSDDFELIAKSIDDIFNELGLLK